MLYLNDPISFKESMLVSLEILCEKKYPQLKDYIKSIPSAVGRISLEPSPEIAESLKNCIAHFKQTKTYFWLREDFKNSIYDIEIQLNKRIS